jgi:hypothetical protein
VAPDKELQWLIALCLAPVRARRAHPSHSLAVSGRLDFTEPASIPGLAWSLSAYYTPNVEPRGAHGDLGKPLGNSSLAMFDAEFRYRVPNTGWEFRRWSLRDVRQSGESARQ